MLRVSSPSARFTVAEYFKMARGGIFGDHRTELINGRVYRMAPQLTPHMAALSKGVDALSRAKHPDEWLVIGGTMRVDKYSAPEPDLLWLSVPIGTPQADWPAPILLIEISDTTYKKDSGVKLRKYAEHAIPDYWIVNLRAGRVEVYRKPQNPTGLPEDCHFDSVEHFGSGQSVTLLQRPKVKLAVDDLLP